MPQYENFDICDYVDKAKYGVKNIHSRIYTFNQLLIILLIVLIFGYLIGRKYGDKLF
jgi:hypothetical protein